MQQCKEEKLSNVTLCDCISSYDAIMSNNTKIILLLFIIINLYKSLMPSAGEPKGRKRREL